MNFWIARDADNELFIYDEKPIRGERKFICGQRNGRFGEYMEISSELFPEVTFENSPQEVEIIKKF